MVYFYISTYIYTYIYLPICMSMYAWLFICLIKPFSGIKAKRNARFDFIELQMILQLSSTYPLAPCHAGYTHSQLNSAIMALNI